MEIRGAVDMEKLKKFYPVLRKEEERKAKPKKRIQKKKEERTSRCVRKIKPQVEQAILKEKVTRKQRIKNQDSKKEAKLKKKEQRLDNLDGKLLTQLQMIQQRMDTMEKDKERYALTNSEFENGVYKFTIFRIGDATKIEIVVNSDFEATCSCMDWRIRCRGLAIPCKHLYYLLVKILTYSLYEYYDNVIMQRDEFKQLVARRIRTEPIDFTVKEGDSFLEEACPICYIDFKNHDNIDQIVRCPDCRHFAHRQCVLTWLNNSPRRNCIMCRSESWNMLFNNN
jgi:hypothetical protein